MPSVTLHVPSSKERDADMAEYVRELYRLIPRPEAVDGDAVCYLDLVPDLFSSCVLPRTCNLGVATQIAGPIKIDKLPLDKSSLKTRSR